MANADDFFPIPLSDFEYYAFRDDSVEHPVVIIIRTPFEGTLDEAAFNKALRSVMKHNPLLRAVVDESGWGKKWKLLKDSQPDIRSVQIDSEYPPANCPPKWIDLTKQAGASFELRLCKERGALISHFHHACVDGIGAIRFLGDVFAEYGRLTATCDTERPSVRVPDPSVLGIRGAAHRPGNLHQKRPPVLYTLMETCRLLFRKNYRLGGSPQPESSKETTQNVVHTAILPRNVVKQLRILAAGKGVSTNDLCMMTFLQQLADWSTKDGHSSPNDLIRVLMPVSMRTPDHDDISASGVMSYVFHSYRRRKIGQTGQLLAAINKKSYQMVNRNEGAAMLKGFALTRRIPGLFRLSQKFQPDFATAVLSNVGEVRRLFDNRFKLKRGRAVAGNIVIQSVDGIAPVRKNTNITVAFGSYGGELIMNLNRNTNVFSEAEADKMISTLANRIAALVDVAEPEPVASVPVPNRPLVARKEKQATPAIP